jgi:CO/xanthine dehydrogenase FAD-binding subunit
MITQYHRPQSLEEALKALSRPNAVPLGGGTLLSKPGPDPLEAVDLQLLGLDSLRANGDFLELGATLTLQALLESDLRPEALKRALKLEAPLNIRNAATVAGTLAACDGRSPCVTMLMAADAKIEQAVYENSKIESRTKGIGEYLSLRSRQLITKIIVPLNIRLAFEYVSRTPSDTPIVCVGLAGWASGRVRMAVGGYGKSPMLALDGAGTDDLVAAARNAFHEAADEYGSAEYRMAVSATLAKRCADSLA